MQAAHTQWMSATRALDDLIAGTSGDVPSLDENLRVAKAAGEQRIAFEEYIEARLAFSESLLDRDCGTGTPPDAGSDSKQCLHETARGFWTVRTASQLALPALAVASLCAAVFGLAYLTHERGHIRDLDAASNANNAMLSQARSQSPSRNLDVGNSSSQGAIQRDGRRPIQTRRPHQQKQTVSAAMPYKALVPVRRGGQRNNFEFTLAASPRYARIGPIRVSVQNLDRKHDCFDLSVMLGDFRLDRKHVKRYQAVWINLGASSARVRLLADRIGRNEVHGYLSSPEPKPALSHPRALG